MPNITMAFDENVQGWTSEFDFVPDSAISLNNKFFSFHQGSLWQHNIPDVPRNNFYGIQGDTVMQFVFNQNPTTVKNFKTMSYEGVGEWPAEFETNLETGAVTYYVNKEGERYNFIQGKDAQQYDVIDFKSNAVQGLGILNTVQDTVGSREITLEGGLPLSVNPGDVLYRVALLNDGATPQGGHDFIGVVDQVVDDIIGLSTSGTPENVTKVLPVNGDLILSVKDNRHEKSGIIGYYSVVTMTNTDIEKAEIFAVNSESFIQTTS